MAHPMAYDYIPPGLFRFLTAKSGEEVLSLKELKIMFLRDWCERLGFKCEHPHNRITNAHKDVNRPYCKDCWRRLEKKESHIVENGKLVKKTYFAEIETFVDRINQDQKQKEQVAKELFYRVQKEQLQKATNFDDKTREDLR